MGPDSGSETTGSTYDLDSIKINQGTVHEGEEEIIERIKGRMKDLEEEPQIEERMNKLEGEAPEGGIEGRIKGLKDGA